MSEPDGLRALVTSTRRWYSLRFVVPASLAFVAVVTAFLPVWRVGGEGADIATGSVAAAAEGFIERVLNQVLDALP